MEINVLKYNWYNYRHSRDTVLQAGRSLVRFPMVSFEFFINIILPATLCVRSTQPLTEMSIRNSSSGSKGGWCVELTILPSPHVDCLKICKPQPPRTLKTSWSLYRDCFTNTALEYCQCFSFGHDVWSKVKIPLIMPWRHVSEWSYWSSQS